MPEEINHDRRRFLGKLLIVVGEHDAECPSAQSYEFWHALRTLNVPTQLIIYPGDGHLFVKPENQADRLKEYLAWFEKYLKN